LIIGGFDRLGGILGLLPSLLVKKVRHIAFRVVRLIARKDGYKERKEMTKQPRSKLELDNLNIEQLMELRDRADELIGRKVQNEKKVLQEKLSAIERFEQRTHAAEQPPLPVSRRRRANPKYRDPSSGATWAGRGQVPRWMVEHIKRGAKREDFRIVGGERRE
jgi:DNA-binding protein H-NS